MPIACSANTGHVQGIADPNLGYVVGAQGVITQWKFQAGTGGGTLALQTLANSGPIDAYAPIAESAIETPTASTLNTFDTRIPVTGGEFIGLRVVTGSPDCLYGGFPEDFNTAYEASPAPVVGSGSTIYGNPQDGARLNVEAVVEWDDDGDGFGDQTQDGCPQSAQRHDDCVKPTVTMDKGKPRKRKATFAFSSDEPGTFECHLENKKFKPCTSPVKLKRLKPGLHNFTVRAVDLNNNKSTQTSFQWRVKKPRKKG